MHRWSLICRLFHFGFSRGRNAAQTLVRIDALINDSLESAEHTQNLCLFLIAGAVKFAAWQKAESK